jgi:hypothetical protein
MTGGDRQGRRLADGVAWLEQWGLWKASVSGYLVAQFETCAELPEPPPRFMRAARIAERACHTDDLPQALKLLERADAAVERALLFRRPLRRSRTPGRSRIDPRLSNVASRLDFWDMEVRCWHREEWPVVIAEIDEYYVERRRDLEGLAIDEGAHLNGQWCDVLADFPGGRTEPTIDDADALLILAHEATHLGVGGSEAQVQCHALQSVEEAAQLLRAPPGLARELANVAAKRYHAWAAEYRSAACRPDGPWDETPNDGVWP